jgi:hypothetical protein
MQLFYMGTLGGAQFNNVTCVHHFVQHKYLKLHFAHLISYNVGLEMH